MNSDVVISVEDLGKRYSIRHQRDGSSGYQTFREMLSSRAKRLFRGNGDSHSSSLTSDLGPQSSESSHGTREDFWALKDVSFEVKRGEVLGIIGRNGAGKTTLLKILSRITDPTEGRVRIKGRVASLLEVGTGFHPELTGRENIYLNGAILGMSKAEIKKKFDEIVAFAETEKFLDTPVKRYSSGMYVRLAFAVAAHLEPEILVVDEVLAVGDAEFQKKCLGKMDEVAHREGRTVLFVSHNMNAIQALCPTVLVIELGSVKYRGAGEAGIQYYLASIHDRLDDRKASPTKSDKRVEIIDAWMERAGERCNEFMFGDNNVTVVLVIHVTEPTTCAVELVLRDVYQHSVAFAPAGLTSDDCDFLPGRYVVKGTLPSLRLAHGQFAIDLLLAVSGVKLLDEVPSGLKFQVNPTSIGKRNWTFSQNIDRGCLLWDVTFSAPQSVDDTELY